MATTELALARLCDPCSEVSAHYLIAEGGQVLRLVAEENRAWHAGSGKWGSCSDVNSQSIGIELANTGQSPFAARQIDALESLLGAVMSRWDIPAQRVIAHSDMAPTRKRDPGSRFDWRRLALSGLAIWPTPTGTECDSFAEAARRFGYPDTDKEALLSAFRLRFRPWGKGDEDAVDRALICDLAERFPVDPEPLST